MNEFLVVALLVAAAIIPWLEIENARLRGSFRALMERFGNIDNWTISDEPAVTVRSTD